MTAEELQLLEQGDKLQGIYSNEDISIDVYHSPGCPGISKSGLDMIEKFPAYYKYYYVDGNKEQKETPSLIFGSALHVAVLEPDLFETKYSSNQFALDKGSSRTKAYKTEIEKFTFDNPNKIIISVDLYETVSKMKEAIYKHPIARNVFSKGKAEQTIFWKENGSICKTRIDFWREDNYIVDLKSIADAKKVSKDSADRRYHVQDAILCRGAEAVTGRPHKAIFVFVEKEEPFGIRVVELKNDAKILGDKLFYRNLNTYAECKREHDSWPDYNVNGKMAIEIIDLPKWEYTKEENEL